MENTSQPEQPAPQAPVMPQAQQVSPSEHHPEKKNSSLVVGVLVLLLVVLGASGLFMLSRNRAPVPIPQKTQTVAKQPLTLTLESPTENSVVENSKVEVKGKTLPNATVAFFTDSDDNSVQSDSQGNFSGTINVENGINTLNVTAYSDDGDEKTVVMDIVYDQESAAK